jgi:predicted ester cyclase
MRRSPSTSTERAFPDFNNEIEEVIFEGNKAFARLTYHGTHLGELFGIAPTGKGIQYAGTAQLPLE